MADLAVRARPAGQQATRPYSAIGSLGSKDPRHVTRLALAWRNARTAAVLVAPHDSERDHPRRTVTRRMCVADQRPALEAGRHARLLPPPPPVSVCFMGWHACWRCARAAGSRPSGWVVWIGYADRQWIQIQVWRPLSGDAPVAGRGDGAPSGLPGQSVLTCRRQTTSLWVREKIRQNAPWPPVAPGGPGPAAGPPGRGVPASAGSVPGRLSIASMGPSGGIGGAGWVPEPGITAGPAQPAPSACWSSGQAWCRSRCQYGQSCARSGQPVGVETRFSAIGHHHEHIAVRGQRLDVGQPGPALIGVTTAMQQVQNRPAAPGPGRVAHRKQQPDLHRLAERGRGDGKVSHPGRQHGRRHDPQLRRTSREPGPRLGLRAPGRRRHRARR